jgi:hypothetical protein
MRSIEDIYYELANHPDFVMGNYLARTHVLAAGYDPDALPEDFADMCADDISDTMFALLRRY